MDIHCQEDRCDFITREQCPIIAGIFPNNVDTIQVIWNTNDQTLQESETFVTFSSVGFDSSLGFSFFASDFLFYKM